MNKQWNLARVFKLQLQKWRFQSAVANQSRDFIGFSQVIVERFIVIKTERGKIIRSAVKIEGFWSGAKTRKLELENKLKERMQHNTDGKQNKQLSLYTWVWDTRWGIGGGCLYGGGVCCNGGWGDAEAQFSLSNYLFSPLPSSYPSQGEEPLPSTRLYKFYFTASKIGVNARGRSECAVMCGTMPCVVLTAVNKRHSVCCSHSHRSQPNKHGALTIASTCNQINNERHFSLINNSKCTPTISLH